MFFSLCLTHSYLPKELMDTVVVPVIKNKTGDGSDLSNYRPISLATITAKVLDSLLNRHLGRHLNLNDAQFGFRPGLSTESAILCLKQTVKYYTGAGTPVYACFLDLSKAFDLVSYEVLWKKLTYETTMPLELTSLLKYWYSHQKNRVRWREALSEEYQLECGVRQGGLTSPSLFNLYMNGLIDELSKTNVGCHINGVCVNNISYADDMVLLSPSAGALKQLLSICESYAVAHGLRYNAKKSELMLFKAHNKSYTIPTITLGGSPLSVVTHFKYLGHWVTEDLKDDMDIERERRSLSVRCNMLARRFARCTQHVKVTLFKAFLQYNNAFRVLMGLPHCCSASGMFAEARVDGFHAIMRKRSASLLNRWRGSTNSILTALADRWDCPLLAHLSKLHTTLL
ncbi:hypothetical protein ABMA27_016619 [Loxostege sticticalis]|uniref:Reverse transcriptase domain-containing protein n=1 Tax=Loxostege sticticalis TaxID=481309 RepID=A0ABR3I308_LOXSC